ncbi:hypothetical protein [Klebsiella grimontii]
MIYFDTVKKVSLEDLEHGDYFKVYLGKTVNQSNGPDKFFGKLTKVTEMKFKCCVLTHANTFGMSENNSIPKSSFEKSLQKEYFYNQDRILSIFKVTIREENEVHEYQNEQHPSTFMNEDDYELI